jgi:3-dehydroquinate synthase II/3-amino-4-hydroxybenzoic acid synthase
MTTTENAAGLKKARVFWFDGRRLQNEAVVLPLVYNLRFEYLVIDCDMLPKVNTPHKIKLIVDLDDNCFDFKDIPKEVIILSTREDILRQARELGYQTALYQRIENQEDLDSAWLAGSRADFLVVELTAATNIPLELLIARLQDKSTVLLKKVTTLEETEIALGVMEAGSDGVLLRSEAVDEIMRFNDFMEKRAMGKLELVKARVIDVQHIGMGYRACIDTTNLMQKNEGMIIGSTSSGGLLVSSETHYLPYMETRPFRVNAGAVHSYVWASGETTSYLTELKGGSKLLCVDTEGNTREVSVGRVKIELRPLLKIEAEASGVKINTIVQDDWHIRIFGGDGEVRNASAIKEGNELLAYICAGGRHVGIKINETIEER